MQTFFKLLFLVFFVVAVTTSTIAGNHPLSLIAFHSSEKHDPVAALHFFEQKDAALRFQEITINEKLKVSENIGKGDGLILNFFDDVIFDATVRRAGTNVNGTVYLTALVDDLNGYLTLATTGKRTLGSLYLPDISMYYKIISDPQSFRHYLIEMDARDRDILESSPPLISELTPEDITDQERIREHLTQKGLGPDDWANIDVMVLYTPNARNWAEHSGGGIENVVAVAMGNAQLVLDNSKVSMAVTLVHSDIYGFQESGTTSNDLWTFRNSPAISDLRNKHSADLVAVFAQVNDVGGIAYLLNTRAGNPATGFSITRVQQAASSYTHIHEMGHNMGCHHHKNQNFQPGPTEWTDWPENYWSAGWRWQGADGNYYCSVMTYTSGQYYEDGITHTEVPYFSSPDILYEGVPAGHPFDGDNARTLKEIKHVIAAYRLSGQPLIITKSVTDIQLQSAVSGGMVIDDAGEAITERGIVWDIVPDPTVERNIGMISQGEGIGTFSSVMTDLAPTTTHYVKAFAVSESGVSYGGERVFNTLEAHMASVSTGDLLLIAHNAAYSGGNVFDGGNSEVTRRGLVWNTQPNPTLTNSIGFTEDGTGTGEFTTTITGLKADTEYYYRAYAENLGGVRYGAQETFTTIFAQIYPNPFQETLNVAFTNESDGDVYLVLSDPRGNILKRRPVSEQGDLQKALNVAHLSSGIYFLSIESDFKFPVWQLLKLRE